MATLEPGDQSRVCFRSEEAAEISFHDEDNNGDSIDATATVVSL